jgi:hypothetical protein
MASYMHAFMRACSFQNSYLIWNLESYQQILVIPPLRIQSHISQRLIKTGYPFGRHYCGSCDKFSVHNLQESENACSVDGLLPIYPDIQASPRCHVCVKSPFELRRRPLNRIKATLFISKENLAHMVPRSFPHTAFSIWNHVEHLSRNRTKTCRETTYLVSNVEW